MRGDDGAFIVAMGLPGDRNMSSLILLISHLHLVIGSRLQHRGS
jgi:hypothetical protein